jgi:gamma-glutamylcyclotransferase (GGCT)/AIG2-like uncharacterized protein YtfP
MQVRHWLFSYGTLRQPRVQQELFGRMVESVPDVLPGFRLDLLAIVDAQVIALSGSDVHPVLRRGAQSDEVVGSALRLTAQDLRRTDSYEVSEYVRVEVALRSGKRAFAYVHRDDAGAT